MRWRVTLYFDVSVTRLEPEIKTKQWGDLCIELIDFKLKLIFLYTQIPNNAPAVMAPAPQQQSSLGNEAMARLNAAAQVAVVKNQMQHLQVWMSDFLGLSMKTVVVL